MGIKDALQRSDEIGLDGRRIGSERLETALADFVDGWRDGRRRIIERIDGQLARIGWAIDTYREQEAALSRATEAG